MHDEVASHDRIFATLTIETPPSLCEAYGIGPDTAAELLIVLGDNPERIESEAAFAKRCGACPIPASSGLTNKHRLLRGGHRQANSALYRTAIVRMRLHEPIIAFARRTAEGLTKKDIIRCLKRFIAREAYQRVNDRPSRSPCRRHRKKSLTIGASTRWPRASVRP